MVEPAAEAPAASPEPVAVAVAATEEPKKSMMDSLWNDSTKLTAYLAVWYLGNIYCKALKLFPNYSQLHC